MRKLSIREMRAELRRLEELVEEEGEVIVMRHGKPVARVLPVKRAKQMPSHRALRESMPRIRVSSEVLVRRDREER